MDYGSSHGSGFGGRKQSLGFDAAASERDRLAAAMRDRQRQEKERAKQQLADLERKLDLVKREISHRETEHRRLESEAVHKQKEVEELMRDLKLAEEKEHAAKAKVTDATVAIQRLEKEILEHKKASDKDSQEIKRLESEMAHLNAELNEDKKAVYEEGSKIQKLGLEIKQNEAMIHKHSTEITHTQSARMYKEKEVENGKRAFGFLDQKKKHEQSEILRLKSEINKMESEIKGLQAKAR